MKILYCANIRLPTEKAHGVQIMKMCEAFAAEGHDVILLVPKRPTPIVEDAFTYYSVRRSFRIERVSSLDFVRFWGRVGFYMQFIAFSLRASLYARRIRPDMLYSRDPEVVATAGWFGIKHLTWEAHTLAKNIFAHAALRHAQRVVCITRGLAEELKAQGLTTTKTLIAPDAVDLQEFTVRESKEALRAELGLPKDAFIVAYTGKFRTMGHPKGVEEIIEAAGVLSSAHPELFLLVVGFDAHEVPVAEEIAGRAGLSRERVRFVTHVPRARVPRYLCAADLLLMNYPNTPHYARIMSPLKVFEYMASGTPMITTDLPSLREVLSEREAYFVPPGDTAAFARGIAHMMQYPQEASAIGARARERSKQYSWVMRARNILASV